MCLQPIKIKYSDNYKNYRGSLIHAYNTSQMLPCGKCLICKENKIEEWINRWTEQIKITPPNTSYFLTLTYSDANLTYITSPKGKLSTLNYDDVQKFLKRLRKRQTKIEKINNLPPSKIVYHGCGEYGKKYTKRPHYHILITNCIVPSNEFEKIWGKGLVHVGDNVDGNSIKYILKYSLKQNYKQKHISKVYNEIKYNFKNKAFPRMQFDVYEKLGFKVHNPDFIEQTYHRKDKLLFSYYNVGENKYRVIEKSFMSKGIGKNYLTPKKIQEHIVNPLLGYLYHDIKKQELKMKPLPRYYKELIFNPNQLDENGKIIYRENGQPLKKWRPQDDDYIHTPRYKRQLLSYRQQLKKEAETLQLINDVGYDNYLQNKLYNENLKKQKLEKYIAKGEQFRDYNAKLYGYEMLI